MAASMEDGQLGDFQAPRHIYGKALIRAFKAISSLC
jgi:hypothetical protein